MEYVAEFLKFDGSPGITFYFVRFEAKTNGSARKKTKNILDDLNKEKNKALYRRHKLYNKVTRKEIATFSKG